MNGKSKLTHRQQEQTEARHDQQQQTGRSFDDVEHLLRYDSEQNPVPEKVAARLQESVDREQLQLPRPWWKRWWRRESPKP